MAALYPTMKRREPTVNIEGRQSLFVPAEERHTDIHRYFESLIVSNREIATAPDGPFTWILKQTKGGPLLAAARTRSKQEIGTLHRNLADYTPPGDIVAAGEFLKTGPAIQFNIQSGTFMKPVFDRIKDDEERTAFRDSLVAEVATAMERLTGLSVAFLAGPAEAGEPIIDPMDIRTAPENIAFYRSLFTEIPFERPAAAPAVTGRKRPAATNTGTRTTKRARSRAKTPKRAR